MPRRPILVFGKNEIRYIYTEFGPTYFENQVCIIVEQLLCLLIRGVKKPWDSMNAFAATSSEDGCLTKVVAEVASRSSRSSSIV